LGLAPYQSKQKIPTHGKRHGVAVWQTFRFVQIIVKIIRTYIVPFPSLSKQLFGGMDFRATFNVNMTMGVDSWDNIFCQIGKNKS
jgi:hypothetical protein